MLPPLPRRSDWRYYFALPSSRSRLPRNDSQVVLRITLFEACSAFTRVAACTLALSPYFVTRLSEGFRHFVTSMPAPVASGWSVCRVGLAPTGKRRLCTAHVDGGSSMIRSHRSEPVGRTGPPRSRPPPTLHPGHQQVLPNGSFRAGKFRAQHLVRAHGALHLAGRAAVGTDDAAAGGTAVADDVFAGAVTAAIVEGTLLTLAVN
jgi:hypothetical protein